MIAFYTVDVVIATLLIAGAGAIVLRDALRGLQPPARPGGSSALDPDVWYWVEIFHRELDEAALWAIARELELRDRRYRLARLALAGALASAVPAMRAFSEALAGIQAGAEDPAKLKIGERSCASP